jgi:hypothetical protein
MGLRRQPRLDEFAFSGVMSGVFERQEQASPKATKLFLIEGGFAVAVEIEPQSGLREIYREYHGSFIAIRSGS